MSHGEQSPRPATDGTENTRILLEKPRMARKNTDLIQFVFLIRVFGVIRGSW